jgi:hypothetical protein
MRDNCWHRLDHVEINVLSDVTDFIEIPVLRLPYSTLTIHAVQICGL